ncbi:MAG: phospho-sugar mutase [Bacteroidetes bacterium]|nr:MAG: phospho-sugar mutase [Bacteroidota bacterium]
MLTPEISQKINEWLDGPYDAQTKSEIQRLLDAQNRDELTDAFYKDLEFGTGGLRGIMGAGSNRMNKYTVGMATQGLANYLLKAYPGQTIKVAISHDNRNNSDYFARIVAEIFSANDIQVYFFESLRPTPELSFAIRELGCKSGVMLTASHNPKEYNGYKVYGADGGQVIPPEDQAILTEVRKITQIADIKFDPKPQNIHRLGREMDEKYINRLVQLSLAPDAIRRQKDLKIVYSPIHGTGSVIVPPTLKKFGFENVLLVEEQMTIDGNFPTVIYPTPEEEEAMTLALQKARDTDADLVLATDPDADRVGVGVKNDRGEFVLLNGNQAAVLLIHYVLSGWEKAGKLTGREYIVKTVVTSYLIDKIAAAKKVECFNTLTGFKWIGNVITRLEGQKQFICGGEESYGYMVGDHVRDKDAVISCAMFAEMAAWYKDQGTSLFEALKDIYLEYGFYKEKLIAITKKGKQGAEEIQAIMDKLRQTPPQTLGGSPVATIKDYRTGIAKNMADGTTRKMDFPTSNVLQFITDDGSIVSARPSGTEPKIKFYCSVNEPLEKRDDFYRVNARLDEKIDHLMRDLMQ